MGLPIKNDRFQSYKPLKRVATTGRPLMLRFLVYISKNSHRASRSLVIISVTYPGMCVTTFVILLLRVAKILQIRKWGYKYVPSDLSGWQGARRTSAAPNPLVRPLVPICRYIDTYTNLHLWATLSKSRRKLLALLLSTTCSISMHPNDSKPCSLYVVLHANEDSTALYDVIPLRRSLGHHWRVASIGCAVPR